MLREALIGLHQVGITVALGAQHVAFHGDDIRATVRKLSARGVEFFSDVNVVDLERREAVR